MNCNQKNPPKKIKPKTTFLSISPAKPDWLYFRELSVWTYRVLPETSKKDFTSAELPHPSGY